jgi:hypothetical protein
MTETALKNAAMKKLAAWYPGGFFWRQGATPYGRAGIPDILGVIDGVAVALEAKQPGRYAWPTDGLTASQKLFSEKFEDAGGIYIVFDCLDLLKPMLRSYLSFANKHTRRSCEEVA